MGLAGFEVEVEQVGKGTGLETEEMTLNMGPQHPSTHGVLRFVVKADGEVMREAIPDVGYLHRAIELARAPGLGAHPVAHRPESRRTAGLPPVAR